MMVGSSTFGNPLIQKVLQKYSSPIVGTFELKSDLALFDKAKKLGKASKDANQKGRMANTEGSCLMRLLDLKKSRISRKSH